MDEEIKEPEEQFVEDEGWAILAVKNIADSMKEIRKDKKTGFLVKLEAARIEASCYGIIIPEGLLHKVQNPPIGELKLKDARDQIYEEFFKDSVRTRLRIRRSNLRKKIQMAVAGKTLIHPNIVKTWKIELRKLDQQFKKKEKKKELPDGIVLAGTEESSRKMRDFFAGAGVDVSNGEE